MSAPIEVEPILLAEPMDPRYEAAAGLLERALQAGSQDPQAAYLLALAHKRQGKTTEARAALRKIARPDANVFLQMGLLSLRENNFAQAEQEFARAWQMDARSFPVCHNLLFTRLSLGQTDTALELLPQALELAPTREQKRFFAVLGNLLKQCRSESASRQAAGGPEVFDLDAPSALEGLTQAEEQRLLQVIRSLGQVETALLLLKALARVRPGSPAVQEALVEAALVRARELMARCFWTDAQLLLAPLIRERAGSRSHQAALNNLLGCCCFLTQDFERAATHFTVAVRLASEDPRLHQNLALAHEFQGEVVQAENHWTRFLELLADNPPPAPPGISRYDQALEFQTLLRLSNLFALREKWNSVLNYLQRAHRLRPDDEEVLERLFHIYVGAVRQPHNARKFLDKLRARRPNDPQLDLYELDLVEPKNLSDIERRLTEIERIMRRYPDDHRVEERAVSMVGSVIPLMGSLCDQLTDQLNKVLGQVDSLPRYQVDWAALNEIMRDLMKEFQKLRRITGKCLPLVSNAEHRRIVQDLADHIDQKIEACRALGGEG